MSGSRGRRSRKLLDDLKEKSKLKEETLDRTIWRTRFGRGYGPVVKADKRVIEWIAVGILHHVDFCSEIKI